jgi:hypothetical protein
MLLLSAHFVANRKSDLYRPIVAVRLAAFVSLA